MGYGEIIKRAFAATRSRSPWLFALVAGVFYLPATVGLMVVMGRFMNSGIPMPVPGAPAGDVEAVISMLESVPWLALASLGVGLLGIPAYVLFETGIAIHTHEFLAGRTMPFRALWSRAVAAFPRSMGAYAVLYVPWITSFVLFSLAAGLAARGLIDGLIARGDATGVLVWTLVAGIMMVTVVIAALVAFVGGLFALRAAALDGSPAFAAARWALAVLRRATREIGMMYGVLYLVQLAYSTVVSLITTPVLVVLMSAAVLPLAGSVDQAQLYAASYRAAIGIMMPIYLLATIAVAPLLVFVSSAWTVFYERLVGRSLAPAGAVLSEEAHA